MALLSVLILHNGTVLFLKTRAIYSLYCFRNHEQISSSDAHCLIEHNTGPVLCRQVLFPTTQRPPEGAVFRQGTVYSRSGPLCQDTRRTMSDARDGSMPVYSKFAF